MAFTDNFTGTDGDNLEDRTGWTLANGSAGAAEINASNQLKFSVTDASSYQAPAASDENHYCQAVRRYDGSVEAFFFPWCICLADSNNFIGCRYNVFGGDVLQIYKAIGGTFTKIAEEADTNIIGDTIKIERSGTAITVYANTVSELTATVGASELLNNTPGIRVRNLIIDPVIDDWESQEAAGGARPQGPLGHPFHGPFAGPIG